MAYTRAWDETFPPDSQAANLLGDDIRKMKTDVRERVGTNLCDIAANRPTPEASWAGLIYVCSDTGEVFRFNGVSWDLVPIVGSAPATGVTNYANGSASTYNKVTIPGGTLTPGKKVDIHAIVQFGADQVLGATGVLLKFGGTTVMNTMVTTYHNGYFAVFRVTAYVVGAASEVFLAESKVISDVSALVKIMAQVNTAAVAIAGDIDIETAGAGGDVAAFQNSLVASVM